MTQSDYHTILFYSAENRSYIADAPDLKSCSAFRESPEEALKEVLVAKTAWLEGANVLPPPGQRGPLPAKPGYKPGEYGGLGYR